MRSVVGAGRSPALHKTPQVGDVTKDSMPTPALDPQKRDEVLRLKAKGYTHRQISDMAGVSVGAVSNYVNQPKETDRIDEYAEFHREKFLELQDRFNRWIGDTSPVKTRPRKPASKRIRAATANDFHVPYHNERAVARLIHDTRGKVDELWIAGDFLDLFAVSRYPHTRQSYRPIQEFQHGRIVLRALSEAFPRIVVMPGNHDARWLKYLNQQKDIPAEIIEFMEFMCPGSTDPLAKLCSMFPNIELVEARKLDFAAYPHFHQIGDLILSHAERFSVIPNKAVTDVVDHLQKRSLPMGVVKPFRVVGQAHTHHAGKTWGPYGVVGFELGCLAAIPDYDGSPKLGGGGPPVLGYTIFEQENGVTDVNGSNFFQLA